jgi:orotidine-5'-phosphate decarboxylase
MARPDFKAMLQRRWARGHFVSLGLDPEWSRMPGAIKAEVGWAADPPAIARATVKFCAAIISATKDAVCAYKPNAAFFEALGLDGIAALGAVMDHIHAVAPDVPVIYDAKRGDIGSTNEGYARHAFDRLAADAITLHPYLGREALRPFLERTDKGIILLCRTSNPGGGEFQDLVVGTTPDGTPQRLYEVVAERIATAWNQHGNCGLVVGATYPAELARVRAIVGDMPLLVPGIGAQGGDLRRTLEAGKTASGLGMMINSSRGIIFASAGEDFAQAALGETQRLNAEIGRFLSERD